MQGNASLLRDVVVDPDARRRLETIERTVETMIERNERFSHLTERLGGADHAPVDLTAELDELVAAKRRRHPEATIAFDRTAPARVDTDEGTTVTVSLPADRPADSA